MSRVLDELPSIPEFYKGKSIFLTGFTGFLGKVLVEKVLWSCPGIDKIYILLRPKKNKDIKQRLDKILSNVLFSRIKQRNRDELNKIIPLEGDVTLPNLGLSHEHRAQLIQNANIIIHSAATVRFDELLTDCLSVNIKGTKSALELALEMKSFEVFVHVSTAYVNCNRNEAEEKIYPSIADWRKTFEIVDKIDPTEMAILTPKYMNHLPNTYVFVKSLAEQLVQEYSDRLPIVIFRPSIVVCTFDEPFSGWVDNLNGPVGLSVTSNIGLSRTIYTEPTYRMDYYPVDLTIRGIMVAACSKAANKNSKEIDLYNWCSKDKSPINAEYSRRGHNAMRKYPWKYGLWTPNCPITNNYWLHCFYVYVFQLLPALLLDLGLRLAGKEPMVWSAQKRIWNGALALSPFANNSILFHNNNMWKLLERIKPAERKEFTFDFDTGEKRMQRYYDDAIKYLGTWLFNMTEEDIVKAQRLRTILVVLDMVCKGLFWSYLAWTVYSTQLIPRIFQSCINFVFNF